MGTAYLDYWFIGTGKFLVMVEIRLLGKGEDRLLYWVGFNSAVNDDK